MNDFEQALGRNLEKLEAPEGFAARVMERVSRREQERRPRMQSWRLAFAASVLVCAGAGGTTFGYQIHQRHEANEAREQFAVAMRVTNRSLEAVDRGLARIDRTNDSVNGAPR
jgi:hypothetical protein